MKIVHPKINSKIEISDHEISVLVIEEPEFFYELLIDIKKQIILRVTQYYLFTMNLSVFINM